MDSADVEIPITQDSKVEDQFCGAPSGYEPSLFFSNYLFGLGLTTVQDDLKHQSWSPRQREQVLLVYYQLQHLYNRGKNIACAGLYGLKY